MREKAKERADRIQAEYQRFYDFVAGCDQAIVDAWHFTENARRARPQRVMAPGDYDIGENGAILPSDPA